MRDYTNIFIIFQIYITLFIINITKYVSYFFLWKVMIKKKKWYGGGKLMFSFKCLKKLSTREMSSLSSKTFRLRKVPQIPHFEDFSLLWWKINKNSEKLQKKIVTCSPKKCLNSMSWRILLKILEAQNSLIFKKTLKLTWTHKKIWNKSSIHKLEQSIAESVAEKLDPWEKTSCPQITEGWSRKVGLPLKKFTFRSLRNDETWTNTYLDQKSIIKNHKAQN